MEDVAFIQENEIGQVLSKGLAILVEETPEKPIDYLAKWMLNYSEMTKKRSLLKNKQLSEQNKLHDYQIIQNEQKQKMEKEQEYLNDLQKKENELLQNFYNHAYILEEFPSTIPNYIQEKMNATGVYLSFLDHPIQEIPEDNDDQFAHIDKSKDKLLQYMGCSDDHKFMLDEKIEQNFYTNNIFLPNAVGGFQESLFVEDVAHQKDLHFYRIPRLGSYLAIMVEFRKYFSATNLNKCLDDRRNFYSTCNQIDQEKSDLIEEQKTKKEALTDEDDVNAFEEEWKSKIDALVKPEQPEFTFEQQHFVIGLDTLGQDRAFSKDQIEWSKLFVQKLAEAWSDKQQKILEEDVMRQINNEKAQIFPDFQFEEDMEGTEAEEKYKYYKKLIKTDEMKNQLKVLSEYRVLKFQGILQTIIFFLGYKKEDINQQGTNIVEWKKISKSIIEQENFHKLLIDKHYEGQKPEEVEKYQKINRLREKQEDVDQIKAYNQGLGVIYSWLQLYIELRIDDINKRIKKNKQMKDVFFQLQERIIKQQAYEDRQLKRESTLTLHKGNLNEEDLAKFDEKVWDEEFCNTVPEVIVPEEVLDEIDNDYDQEEQE